MKKLLDASPETLKKVDALLDGNGNEKSTKLLTFTDAARRLGVSRPTVYKLTVKGKLKTILVGKARRIPEQAVINYAKGGAS